MKQHKNSLVFVATAMLLLTSPILQACDIYVSPLGVDSNTGSKANPVATITAARDLLRNSGKLGLESCEVIIAAGVYRLNEPITLTPADSGTKAFPVTYRAAENAKVVVTGAQTITRAWKLWKDGIYRTQIGKQDTVDQLIVNDSRQIMARYPDLGAGYVLGPNQKHEGIKAGNAPYDGSTPDAWDASKAKAWADPTGAFMHGMHGGLWGSQHYRVLGKNKQGELVYEGGWQNNRYRSAHRSYRMIENVFEELDSPGEWYHDIKDGWLYYLPAAGVDMASAQFEAVFEIKHLVEFYGAYVEPVATMNIPNSGNGLKVTQVKNYQTTEAVKHIRLQGIQFRGTARTFMETIEPLLRSDWTIYRGAAVHLRGTEAIEIENSAFVELGGNAILVDSYNRDTVIRSNLFRENGASDVVFVGSFAAVRDPAFSFHASARPLDEIDTVVGPKSEDYPADALVEDNLMMLAGRFEKQVAGVNLSMASRITIRHNTISHTPRAGINISDGTWGGHVIEWNDVFETVLETHDHGAFNSWGRDRIWHSAMPAGPNELDENGKSLISYYVDKYPHSPFWDAYQTTILRYNRMQSDHGWDIDLDDGSSNYEIYSNLTLSGGLKTREGYKRIVTNNIILGDYTCNVPYPKPVFDVFERNIVSGKQIYSSSNPTLWGGSRDYTFVHNPAAKKVTPAVALQKQTLDDAHSLYGNAQFVAAEQGNFTVTASSPAFKVGFKNFPMTEFGVTSKHLKALAGTPPFILPKQIASNVYVPPKEVKVLGATVRSLRTLADVSATGMQEAIGSYLIDVPASSRLKKFGFKSGDVVMMIDRTLTPSTRDFKRTLDKLRAGTHTAKVWRGQEAVVIEFDL
ncbi:peptide-binding protein [Paraglaciecola sp. L3A3]|uniref:peptide-binding protein n=1 Tax=Paraglaciecola sp. L3A3 TaxID=2686358 RepID=UPI00131CB220|nr:peptide-binding protein [Paraglaciecola sp. L3A3]